MTSAFSIDRTSKLPLYDQVEQNLRGLIVAEVLKLGEAVPSEAQLASRYGVSRLTVRRALDELVRQDWLIKRRGVGTFVTRPSVATITPGKLSFTQQMQAIGRVPSSRLITLETTAATSQIAHSLGLTEGQATVKITRLRLADHIPVLLEMAFLSQDRFPELKEFADGDRSLYEFLRTRYGVIITRMDQTLMPVTLTAEQASMLDAAPGSPSIYSEIIAFTGSGEPVEYASSVANGNHSAFYFSFNREGTSA